MKSNILVNALIVAGLAIAAPFEESVDKRGKTSGKTPSFTYTRFPANGHCINNAFTGQHMKDTAESVGRLFVKSGKQVGAQNYPHTFENRGPVLAVPAGCTNGAGGNMLEYPIFPKTIFNGGSYTNVQTPDTDRILVVIGDASKAKPNEHPITYCGLITHQGAAGRNNFVPC